MTRQAEYHVGHTVHLQFAYDAPEASPCLRSQYGCREIFEIQYSISPVYTG